MRGALACLPLSVRQLFNNQFMNPYASPKNSTLRRLPVSYKVSWFAAIPQFAILAGIAAFACLFAEPWRALFWGAGLYLAYSQGSRWLVCRSHRRGLQLANAGRFEDAIRAHQRSYEFFTNHLWIDRLRSVTLLTPSAVSYREMALINIAFAYGQLGCVRESKRYYQRALEEFPDSEMANAALTFIEAIERQNTTTEATM